MKSSEFLKLLENVDQEDLISVKGIGEKIAQNIIEFRNSSRYKLLISKLSALELNNHGLSIDLVTNKKSTHKQTLENEVVVITGSFDIARNQIKSELESRGAKVTGSVTKNTTILVAGEKAGSKLSKAEKLGIRVVNNYRSIL